MTEEEFEGQRVVVENKNSREKLVKIFSAIFSIIILIVLIIVRKNNPDFPLGVIILIGALLIAFSGLVFASANIKRYLEKKSGKVPEDKLPEPHDISFMMDKVRDMIQNDDFMDHIVKVKGKYNETFNKERIFIAELETYYEDLPTWVILSQNFPDKSGLVYIGTDKKEVFKMANRMAIKPRRAPDREVTRGYNPLLGTALETIRTSRPKSSKPIEDKKEDLA